MKNLHYLILLLILAVWIPSASISAATNFSFVVLSKYHKTMSIGDEYTVLAATSNGSIPTWKSSNSKVASVNTYGRITAKKAGKVKITAKIRKAEASCLITVRKTTVSLSVNSINLEHGETKRLKVYASTNGEITYRSSRSSIASINEAGVITGEKPGTTKITVTIDGTKAYCRVTVKKPTQRTRSQKETK